MLVSYSWLKEYVEVPWNAQELAERLTMAGLPVDRIENLGEKWSKIIVAEILRIESLPQNPSFLLCEVAAGREKVRLVCGAANIKKGDKVPLALPGTILPNQRKIEKSFIHNLESEGMLCSEAELELGTDTSGIMILESNAKVGQSLTQALNLEDWALELDITPNRPDCLSIYGVAREVSALSGNPLQRIHFSLKEAKQSASDFFQIELENPDDCPRYLAKIIREVRIKPSPAWLARKLYSTGQRPINNVVDITNFVMLELGHPLHAFDYDLFSQKKVLVRRALNGEEFITLDGVKRKLGSEVLLITDGKKAVALAGIMGGQESEVGDTAKNILLESAYFNPQLIRQGRKKLGLATEASSRFERGADPNIVATAANRAACLIAELARGEILKGAADNYPKKIKPKAIVLRPKRVNQILATNLESTKMTKILKGLEFEVKREKNLKVTVPTFRADVTQEVDLIEEIARIYGYERIPVATQNKGVLEVKDSAQEGLFSQIREKLNGWGFQEIISNSLVDPKLLELFGDSGLVITVRNPVTTDQSVLRTNLALSMLQVILTNQYRKQPDLKLFEIGKVYYQEKKKPQEEYRLCLAITGNRYRRSWDAKPEIVDFYDLKGVVQALAENIGIDNMQLHQGPSCLFSSPFSIMIETGFGSLGNMGQVSGSILDRLDIKNDVYLAEIDLEKLSAQPEEERRFQSLAKYPPVERDIAIIVDKPTPANEIVEKIKTWAGGLAEEVGIFDLYQGKQISPDKKSLAFYIRYRSAERTLTEGEISQVQQKIIENLQKEFHAQLRS
ncbi:MAG: phenylalanine--tRNA ligase subunit beta [candidate division Zixibacteria bacterium RBG_16_48_11]|nr:MAG: phenylalanine--tRNA ligase subunit beta [candidate division Zixibacteria bacterium RBG_16_48_11]